MSLYILKVCSTRKNTLLELMVVSYYVDWLKRLKKTVYKIVFVVNYSFTQKLRFENVLCRDVTRKGEWKKGVLKFAFRVLGRYLWMGLFLVGLQATILQPYWKQTFS